MPLNLMIPTRKIEQIFQLGGVIVVRLSVYAYT